MQAAEILLDDVDDIQMIHSRLAHDVASLNRRIALYSSWGIEKQEMGESIGQVLHKINDHSARLSTVLFSAHRLATIELMALSPEVICLRSMCESAAESASIRHPGFEVSINGEGQAIADHSLAFLSVDMLLENAALHGDKNHCSVDVAPAKIVFSNSFNGLLPETLFKPFSTITKTQPGLGLTFVKRIQQRIGGAVSVEKLDQKAFEVSLAFASG